MKQRYKLHRGDIFGMSDTENGKTIRQECQQRYLYIFKMMEKPEVVIGRHLEHGRSHRLIPPNKSEVSILAL